MAAQHWKQGSATKKLETWKNFHNIKHKQISGENNSKLIVSKQTQKSKTKLVYYLDTLEGLIFLRSGNGKN